MFKYTLRPKKPIAPEWLGYFVTFLYLVEAVCICLGVFYVVKSNYINCVITFIAFSLIFLFLIFCSKHFSWYISGDVFINDKEVRYEVLGILDMMGNKKTVHKISSIDDIKQKGSNLIIYGDCTIKEPVGKPKNKRKFVIEDCDSEVIIKINEYGVSTK